MFEIYITSTEFNTNVVYIEPLISRAVQTLYQHKLSRQVICTLESPVSLPFEPHAYTLLSLRSDRGPVAIEEIPTTQPKDLKPGEALVKVIYTGVCHTDLHAMLGDWPLENKLPLVSSLF
jgi:hypothetical protein